ncbi:YheC/YheD family protein [Paenibacillus mesophilus]|uniref:YheC/YheD family protein n=1 Tax=Paenibacillus mesophilus TaxID=2582849 RepID=UPI00110E5847|nr:YheC/YheD family protein [Paenibacillus mesophilus]TMV43806.1 YheC/YheD family protein [Paenibacillus mesophilus]
MSAVGILVDAKVFRNITSGKTGNEHIRLYNKASAKNGLTPVYLCLARIHPSKGYAFGYKYSGSKYSYVKIAIPKVIHNRTMPTSSRDRSRMELLRRRSFVYNSRNRYLKYRIHRMLAGKFSSHLPVTSGYSRSGLNGMMDRYDSLYVKPQSSSIGRGIMKLSRAGSGKWKVQLPGGTTVTARKTAIQAVDRIARRKPYLIQRTIPLAQYRGRPYDIRVSVQRGSGGHWQVTGMVGKVARKGSHVTNVARGGSVKRCEPLFGSGAMNPSKVAGSVKALSLNITRYLGKRLDRLADVGLDIGVTSAGKPYFIELNCRDQRYSFKKAKMTDTFYQTYANPISYAKYLLRKSGK